jgi:hypothetical protein
MEFWTPTDFHSADRQLSEEKLGAYFLHRGVDMNRSRAVRTAMLVLAVAALGCQETRPISLNAPSLFLPSPQGVWAGPLTLVGTSGGECVGSVVPSFLPTNDFGTAIVTQSASGLQGTLTMEGTGLACKYSGTSTAVNIAMNATACDRTGLIVQCVGDARKLELVGSSVIGSWNGDQMTGVTTSTYNVFTVGNPPIGVGSLIATHSFEATRR